MKTIKYAENSCQDVLLASAKDRKTWRNAVSFLIP